MLRYLSFFIFLLLIGCNNALKEFNFSPEIMQLLDHSIPFEKKSTCNDYENYLTDSLLSFEAIRYIRVNIHFVNSRDSTASYKEKEGIKYAKELIYHANRKLVHNKKVNLPVDNNYPVYNPGYQYRLTPIENQNDDQGIYFHYDNELCYYINQGNKRNNYNRKVIDKYAKGEDSILNIFYMVHHPDSILSRTYSASAAGIALGKSIKLGVKFNSEEKPWIHASLLNHEIGHVMGLSHTWNLNDGCSDTPHHPNCWSKTDSYPCNGTVSNNMMDYNSNQHALTPCQIGKIRNNMARIGSRQRDLVIKDWCIRNPEEDIDIDQIVHLQGAKDIKGNITVLPGAVLRISCRLSMPENSEIRVKPGGVLILDNARISNDCGKEWKGIIFETKGEKLGRIYYEGSPEIQNVRILYDRVK